MSTGEAHRQDVWAGADAYERYVGRWSRPVAREFVRWMVIGPGARWLDVGCGTGALTETILELVDPSAVLGVDPSEAYLALARELLGGTRATFAVGDGAALPAADGSVDVVVAGLVLNFLPDTQAALAEWRRVVKAGGAIGAYVWDYAQPMFFIHYFWEAAVALDADARALDEAVRFPINRPEPLVAAFVAAGLMEVSTQAIEVPTRFADFDHFWQPFLGGQGPGPTYLSGLSADQHDALRHRLRASVPIGPDGSIDLIARAWAVRGVSG
jgi:ubiquinone/menaquinone biosynthesis C-methylase UbiE